MLKCPLARDTNCRWLLAGGATENHLSDYGVQQSFFRWELAALLPKLGFCGWKVWGFGMCAVSITLIFCPFGCQLRSYNSYLVSYNIFLARFNSFPASYNSFLTSFNKQIAPTNKFSTKNNFYSDSINKQIESFNNYPASFTK